MSLALGLATFGAIASSTFVPTELSGCELWLPSTLGITLVQGPVIATGTTPPTVTLTGTPSSATNTIEIDITLGGILGVALFSWKLNGVVKQTLQLASASFPLAGTGITASFSAGTYSATDVYTSVVTASAWADQSSGGNNAAQVTATKQPAFVASAINGLPSPLFTQASSQVMAIGSLSSIAQPFTVFCVAQATTMPSAGAVIGLGTSGADGVVRNNGSGPLVTVDTGPYTKQISTAQNPFSAFVACAIFDGTESSAITNGTTVTGTLGTSAISGGAAVGSDNGSNYWGGYIPEIIVYSRLLTASEISMVGKYLATRYAIAGTW